VFKELQKIEETTGAQLSKLAAKYDTHTKFEEGPSLSTNYFFVKVHTCLFLLFDIH
jgi:hypothetical protein